ncbi:MAG TPA: sulfate permease [Planctomycetota bacterium]|nr:sulfate permease [Planctomycetota bacterium]
MGPEPSGVARPAKPRRFTLLPGLGQLLGYQREWLAADVVAGVSVAAIAVPTAIAYAQMIGFEPVVGFYAAILPLVAYAMLGTSRHLIVNPDAGTCALVAATLLPIVPSGDPAAMVSASVVLALAAGVVCIVAGILRLGVVADFLSRPILVGFMNGIAIHIFLDQLGKVGGYAKRSHGIVPSVVELARKLDELHGPTVAVGLACIGLLIAAKRWLPRWPAPLLAVVAAIVAVRVLRLQEAGVATVGAVAGGWPAPRWPEVDAAAWKPLVAGALGVALLSFTNAVAVARSFAAKGGYDVHADRELVALGAAHIASAASGGFAVSGTESRTAMNYAMGGKSPAAGLVAAASIASVLLFFTSPLSDIPKAALGAILMVAAVGLFEAKELVHLWRVSPRELVLAVITTLGVVGLDVLDGILLAVGLSLLLALHRASRPADAVLGRVEGLGGYHSLAQYPDAKTFPGVVLYRFGAALLFFNTSYFRRRVLDAAAARSDAKWLVIEGGPINTIDVTGAEALGRLAEETRKRGVRLALANVRTEVLALLDRAGTTATLGADAVFPSLDAAVEACARDAGAGPVPERRIP